MLRDTELPRFINDAFAVDFCGGSGLLVRLFQDPTIPSLTRCREGRSFLEGLGWLELRIGDKNISAYQ